MIHTHSRPALPTRSLVRSVMLAALFCLLAGCGQIELYSNLQEREANQMMAILLDRGIRCSKTVGEEELTWTLRVDAEDFSKSVSLLTATGFPNHRHARMGEVFQKSGLVSSPTEDRIRYVYALSEELAETITRIDGVVDARVHVVLPNNDPFSDEVLPSSASVYIKHRIDSGLSASRAEIKDLVARSIEGLESDNIEVFMDEVEPISAPVTTERTYSRVLGISLDSGSVTRFWLVVGALALVAVVNLGLMVWSFLHGHRTHLSDSADHKESATRRKPAPAAA